MGNPPKSQDFPGFPQGAEVKAVPLSKHRLSLIPREHGAWGILVFSLALGAGVAGGGGVPLILFTAATLALFLARHPLSLMVKEGAAQGKVLLWVVIYLAAALLAFMPLLLIYYLWWLGLFGLLYALYLAAYLYLAASRKQRTLWGEGVGISGLAMAAPAAYYVSAGAWQGEAFILWLLSLLYHTSSIFYVRLKVRHRTLATTPLAWPHRWRLGWSLMVYLVVLLFMVLALALIGLTPALAFLAYLPLLGKVVVGGFLRVRPVPLRVLGWTEVAHGLVFTAGLITLYYLA